MNNKYLKILVISGFALLLSFTEILAQTPAPKGINYQAIARNAQGNVFVNRDVSLRISILSGSAQGNVDYVETHSGTTNSFGLINIVIGSGIPVTGTFASVNWSTANQWLKVEMDINAGTNYQEIGNSQLLSVPYALYAENSGSGGGGTVGPQGPPGPQGVPGPVGPQGPPGTGGGSANFEMKGKNAKSGFQMNITTPNIVLTDLTDAVTTGANNPKVKISGTVSAAAGNFTYDNLNQVSLGIITVILERATDAAFTQNLTLLQESISTLCIKIPDAYTTTLTRTVVASIGGTSSIDFIDNTVLPNTTYFYRLRVESEIAGQQPTAFQMVVLDRSLNFFQTWE